MSVVNIRLSDIFLVLTKCYKVSIQIKKRIQKEEGNMCFATLSIYNNKVNISKQLPQKNIIECAFFIHIYLVLIFDLHKNKIVLFKLKRTI